jgi:hypothetical protein
VIPEWAGPDDTNGPVLQEIRPIELTRSETSMMAANDLAVRRALEGDGVEFIDENACGVFLFHALYDDYYL